MDKNKIAIPFDVIHDFLGKGVATCCFSKYHTTYIRIKFRDSGLKDFPFPDQFLQHLKAEDPNIQRQIAGGVDVQKRILHRGFAISNRAIDTYDFGCQAFGWDLEKRTSFDKRSILYAQNATPENYAVWCLPHHNLIEPYNENQSWYNYIDSDHIVEIWLTSKNHSSFYHDDSVRLTFIKTAQQDYKFWGVFKPVNHGTREINGIVRKTKTYELIATEYSNQ